MLFNSLVPTPTVGGGKIRDTKASPAAGLAAPNLGEGSQPATNSPKLVYIVENDYIASVLTELIIKKNLAGSEVRCYANGQWAFEELMRTLRDGGKLPDLIVLDLDMPLMDGWEFLDALANVVSAQAIRVILQTSSIQPDDRSKALAYKQVKGFFSKPLQEHAVASLLQQARKAG